MKVNKSNNKFVSYLIILISLFILILFTKDQVMNLQENLDIKETSISELSQKKDKLGELNNLKSEIGNSQENMGKYNIVIKEDEIIDYLYSYVERTNGLDGVALIKSISISESKDTEIGFKETTVNLNLRLPNEKRMKELLTFLTSDSSKYNFFINSFTFPYGETDKPFNVSIPLKIIYN